MIVYGLNAVLEALRAGRARRVSLLATAGEAGGGARRRVVEIVSLAEAAGVPIDTVAADVLERAARGRPHQGVLADVAEPEEWTPVDLVRAAPGVPLLVVLDGIEDPHNLGAILRTAEAAGADGVIRQARRAAPLDGAVARTSAGALAHLRVATVVNIARALEELKEAGVWTVGLAGDAGQTYDAIDLTLPTAIVLGAGGSGLRRLVRETCDWVAAIPMRGKVGSLNVSVAAGIVLFEALRQRRAKGEGTGSGADPSSSNGP
ncbi:MAG TPA: 23S rRNA (guanosine(2251)-2'-O)-methyltransferase RlmB [Vicinamibacterales bacterium]